MSNKLLQVHFAFNGPFGDEMSTQLAKLAQSINQSPVLSGRSGRRIAPRRKPAAYICSKMNRARRLMQKTRRTPAAIWRAGDVLQDFRHQFTTQPD